jgi:acyl-CoA thioester hydrolase
VEHSLNLISATNDLPCLRRDHDTPLRRATGPFSHLLRCAGTMRIAAPFDRYQGEVLAEWIDANGHMNLAYYTVLFDYATDMLFDAIGIGQDYKRATSHGTFVAETHNLYVRELLVGERVRVITQILGADDKRVHVAHEMLRVADGQRSATQELLFLSIDLTRRRVVSFPPDAQRRVAVATETHAHLPRPHWAGRCILMPAGPRAIKPQPLGSSVGSR